MKNKLLVAAVLLVGVASVAYAALAQTLTITGTVPLVAIWTCLSLGLLRVRSEPSLVIATPSRLSALLLRLAMT